MQRQGHGAALAVKVADTVAGVDELVVNVGRVQRDKAEAMGEEFVGDNRGVGFDFNKIDS